MYKKLSFQTTIIFWEISRAGRGPSNRIKVKRSVMKHISFCFAGQQTKRMSPTFQLQRCLDVYTLQVRSLNALIILTWVGTQKSHG